MELSQIQDIIIELLKQVADDESLKTLKHKLPYLVSNELEERRSRICIFCEENEAKILEFAKKHRVNLLQVKRMILKNTIKQKFDTVNPFICENHIKEYSVKQLCENRATYEQAKENVKRRQFEYWDTVQNLCKICENHMVCKNCLDEEIATLITHKSYK